ncbi:thiamine monophosphate synthase [Flavobacterium limnosediminis JC2902]|uniref:Thiamine monophosphate synthase n=1 Tax=Flavobacterium limnosediminis JC2902 TaxID=1341181 RepID=V6SWY7_9FLAO|nr:thiamine phosphate synthase [Flavobacterium limnosediminis]ESU28945.1 thiamine monophosphate synthase [Flavobacterium limnosediminis JC2902]
MIVITNPIPVPNEISIIHSLFAEGLSLLHIRKPDFTEAEMKLFVLAIGSEFKDRLVLHSQHHLAEEFEINRIHYSELKRKSIPDRFWKPIRYYSTSTHSIEAFNALETDFEYAFVSPVYPSISKPNYVSETNQIEAIKKRTNFRTKLVALGGLSSENIQQTLENGFDDVALLGTIWHSTNPIENFKKCQQIAHSF